MSNIGYYKQGDNNAICDRCGRPFKASQLRKTWDGLWVCERDWEPRHPQDYVKAIKEDPTVEVHRPDSEPTFTAGAEALPIPTSEGA